MADVALSLTLGPSTARLDSSAATSGRSNTMGTTATRRDEAHPASAALARVQRDPTESESFHVAGDCPLGHAELAGQLAQPHPLTAGGVQSFDQCLLALNTRQCQVSVAGGRGEPDAVH